MSILTINKDGTPSYNEVNYVLHELEDSRIKRHILSGIITDMEVSDIGAKNTNCRVRYKNQSVLIPISEMGIELSNNDNGDEWVRKTQIVFFVMHLLWKQQYGYHLDHLDQSLLR